MSESPSSKDGKEAAKGQASFLERTFRLSERGATVRGEVIGGLTTFMTMAYIIFVNAAILSGAGMPFGGVMLATCVSAAFATVLMGLTANLPIALAPGMGMNVFIVGLCKDPGISWQTALGMVFWAGFIFLALSVVRFRETLIKAIPENLKHAAAAGIGVFIAFIGLQHAGIVANDPATLVTHGDLSSAATLVALFGLAATGAMMALRVRGAVLYGIIATGIVALSTGLIDSPGAGGEMSFRSIFSQFADTAGGLDLWGALVPAAWPAILTLLFFDMFDTVGTLVGVTGEAGLADEKGEIPNAARALASDAAGSMAGAALGTSTVTSYIESAAGVAAGARTGLSNMVVAALFLFSIAMLPVVGVLATPVVTAPALVVVGFLMAGSLRRMTWDDVSEGFPAFLTVILMPLTYSISTGLAAGFVSYSALKLVRGEARKVHPLVHVIAGTIVVGYAVLHIVSF